MTMGVCWLVNVLAKGEGIQYGSEVSGVVVCWDVNVKVEVSS